VRIKSLCLTKRYAMKTYWGTEGTAPVIQSFLTSALDGGEWSASRPARFTPGLRTPATHWTGGWVEQIKQLIIKVKYSCASPSTTPWIHMGSGGIAPHIPNAATRRRRVATVTIQSFFLWGKNHTGGWAGSRDGPDAVGRRKKIPSLPGIEPGSFRPQPSH
jgi:hypothetical protein